MAFLILEKVLDIIMVVFDFVKDKQKLLRKQGLVIRIILQNIDYHNFKPKHFFTEFLLGIFKRYKGFRMNFGISKTLKKSDL